MASGLVAGCWVFLAGTMPLAKYTNRKKKQGGGTPPGNPLPLLSLPSAPPTIHVLVTPTRIFKLQPFRNVKGDFCRTPSIGFNGHRYSNLFDGGSSSFNPSLSIFLPFTLVFSFSLFLFNFPRQKPLHVTGEGWRERGAGSEKKFASWSLFFFLLLLFFRPSSILARI